MPRAPPDAAIATRRFAGLADDLHCAGHSDDRRPLARHFVRRRRADICAYLDDETPFR